MTDKRNQSIKKDQKRRPRPGPNVARFRAVVDGFGDPILMLDEFQMVRYANQQFVRQFGYPLAEVIGVPMEQFLPADEKQEFATQLEAERPAPESALKFEHRLLKRDRSWEAVETTVNRMDDPSGQGSFMLHVHIITKRRQAEEKIEVQNHRLKVLREIDLAILSADSIESIVAAALNHIRKLIDCRRASLTLFDWEKQEALLFDVKTSGEPSNPKEMRAPLEPYQEMIQVFLRKEPLVINDLSGVKDPPPALQKTIQAGFRSLCSLPLFSQSSLIGTFGMASESAGFFDEEKVNLGREVANQVAIAITQARLVEELRENEDRYHAFFQNSLDAILLTSPDGQIHAANPAACRMFGRTEAEICALTRDQIVDSEDAQLKVLLEERARTGKISGELTMFRQDGSPFPVEISSALFKDRHGNVRTSMIIRDITERRQAEQKVFQLKRLYAALSQINQAIVRVTDRENLYQSICDVAVQYGEFPLAWIGVLDEVSGDVRPVTATGMDVSHWPLPMVNIQAGPLSEGLVSRAIRTAQVVSSEEVQSDQRLQILHEKLRQYSFRASAVIPLLLRGKAIGALALMAHEAGLFQDDEQKLLLQEMGIDIAFALDTLENEKERRQAEQRIRYQADLLENVSDAIIASDMSGRINSWNAAASSIYGWSPEEVMGQTVTDILQTEYPQGTSPVQIWQQFLDEGSWRGEVTQKRKDGTRLSILAAVSQVRDQAGTPTAMVAVNRDITERKQTEKTLRESEEKFSILFDEAPFATQLTRIPDGMIVAVNAEFEKLTGYPRDELLGRNSLELDLYPDPEARARNVAEFQASGSVRNLDMVIRTKRKDSRSVLVNSDLVEIAGQPHVLTVAQDITERKQAEASIQRQLTRLSALRRIDAAISSSFDMTLVLNVVLEEVNSQLGVDASAILLLNRELQTIEYAANRGFRSNALHYTRLKMGEGYAGQAVIQHKTISITDLMKTGGRLAEALRSEGEAFVAYYSTPLIVKGEAIGALEIYHRSPLQVDQEWLSFLETLAGQAAIAIDNARLFADLQRSNDTLELRVIERTAELHHANAELEHANRAKDEFLATMSHELRTPLNSILGLSESLLEQRRGPLNEHQQKLLGVIETSGRHLLELINDILDLSKIDSGRFELNAQSVDVNTLCRSSLAFVQEQAMRKTIQLVYQEDAQVLQIQADPRRLKQILVNLLTNAVKFTMEGGQVTLQVDALVEAEAVQFSIIDTGIGIAPEDMQRLFKPFVQVDSSLTRQFEGTGLGLALVRKLTDLHGGSISVESEAGKGSRFTIRLPWKNEENRLPEAALAENSRSDPRPSSDSESPGRVRAAGVGVLLVEDHAANILTVSEYLQIHGYTVEIAHDGWEAITKAGEMNPQIILMDIQMPGMDGLEATRRLRTNPHFAATPIIALTALAMPGDRERCLEAGASEYMSKPVSLKALKETMERLLGI